MAKYIFKRILTAIPLIIVITILCFSLIHLAPYDAIDAMTTPKMSPEMVQMIREKYGYDQPVYVQYIRWLEGILNGNFGYSIVTKTNIFDELATRIPNTIKLVLPSYLTAYVISIVLGLVAGSHKNKWLDKLIDGICSLWIAMPTFWVAMLFIYLFGYKLRILPILGMHTVGVNTLSDFLLHFITPYLVLTLAFIPDNVRYVRSSTITQYSEDYVMVQKAFVLPKQRSCSNMSVRTYCFRLSQNWVCTADTGNRCGYHGNRIQLAGYRTVFYQGGAGYGLSDCHDRFDIVFHPSSPGKPAVRYFILRDRSAYQKDG